MSETTSLDRRTFIGATAAAVAAGAALSTVGSARADEAEAPLVTFSDKPDWLGPKPVIDPADIVEVVDTEVVIVGGGNSGLPCALTLAEEGVPTVVLETNAQDSMSWYGMADFATVNSEFMLSNGVPYIDPVEFLVDIQKRTQNRSDPKILKRYIDNSGEALDWLVSELDPEFLATYSIPNLEGNKTYFERGGSIHGFKTWIAGLRLRHISNEKAYPKLVQKAVDLGVDWRWETTGVVCVQQDDGTVTGVIARDADGAYRQFNGARAVVLAGGDYGKNPDMYVSLQNEMREEFWARGLDPTGVTAGWGRDGSGIKMGMWAGGVIEPGPHAKIWPDIAFKSDKYASNELFWGSTFDMSNELGDPYGTAWFTVKESDGRRFTDEGMLGIVGMMNRVAHLPAGRYIHIWDGKWAEFLQCQSAEHFMPYSDPAALERWQARLDSWLEGGPDGEPRTDGGVNTCWAANTLDELLDYMGLEGEVKQNVLDEIERYNGFCANGRDEDFGKDPQLLMAIDQPPFYGMKSATDAPMVGTCALNGLMIDEMQRVLDPVGTPIPGLYAMGNNSGGRFSIQYSQPTPGVSIGSAMTMGRVLAKDLAEL